MKKLIFGFVSYITLMSAYSQTTNVPNDFTGKLNKIISECNEDYKRHPKIVELDEEKIPGLVIDTKWLQRDMSKLIDQGKLPTKEEKDAVFTARQIAKECGSKMSALMKSTYPTPFGARYDAFVYYSETYWMSFLNDQLTYEQLRKIRTDGLAEFNDGNKEMNRLWKLGTKESQSEMSKYAETAEAKFMVALEMHQQMIAKRKEMGFTNCRKLGAFEYCSAKP